MSTHANDQPMPTPCAALFKAYRFGLGFIGKNTGQAESGFQSRRWPILTSFSATRSWPVTVTQPERRHE